MVRANTRPSQKLNAVAAAVTVTMTRDQSSLNNLRYCRIHSPLLELLQTNKMTPTTEKTDVSVPVLIVDAISL